jgi:hypothetical protein
MLNSTFPAGLPASVDSAGLEVSDPPPPPELVGEGVPGVEVTGSFASGLALTRTLSMILSSADSLDEQEDLHGQHHHHIGSLYRLLERMLLRK